MKKIKKLLAVSLIISITLISGCSVEHEKQVEIESDPLYCTKEYNPVCANVQIDGKIVEQTFPNECTAGNNEIIHKGECYN